MTVRRFDVGCSAAVVIGRSSCGEAAVGWAGQRRASAIRVPSLVLLLVVRNDAPEVERWQGFARRIPKCHGPGDHAQSDRCRLGKVSPVPFEPN
jgi:hypothetical protein